MAKWSQTRLKPGLIVSQHYEIEQITPWMGDVGGLGAVYSARHQILDRRMAVNVAALPLERATRDRLLGLSVDAAREGAKVLHPNVWSVYDVGTQLDGKPSFYIISDLTPGVTLGAHLKRHGPLERPRALRLFISALDGLAEYHAQGLTHGSLKASTLLLTRPGRLNERLVIGYMGLSHLERSLFKELVSAGRARTSLRHLAPEVLSGRSEGDLTSDVFQMALLLVQMLVGDVNIAGWNALDVLRTHMEHGVTISQALHLGELGGILERALNIDPAARFRDARDFARALRRLERMPQAGDASTSGHELSPGDVLAEVYEVVKEIGRGGFAVVYSGVQRGINRDVAIKLMTVQQLGVERLDEYEARFLREARAAAAIDHPNVVTIHHFGLVQSTGQPYMVMELLSGHDLEQELTTHGGMRPQRALPLIRGVLDALGDAHRQGIVHKDLKPSNLFLVQDRRGREVMKITDFGIATHADSDEERLTQEGQPVCTPSYAAPEYVQELLATPALDVYQIGLVLVEMLTGQPVVDAETVSACIRMHVSGRLSLPERLMSGPLGPVLRQALAVDCHARYRDADAMLEDLNRVNPVDVEV